MKIHIQHLDRKWRHAENHMDARRCPDCGCTVNGNIGQHQHREYHERQDRILVELCKRVGIAEEQIDEPWTWSAITDAPEDTPAELEQSR